MKLDLLVQLADMSRDEWRFWSYVDFRGEGCWEWLGAKRVAGYGAFTYHGKTFPAHRIAWLFATGEVLTSDQILLHSCDNPSCVNIAHLSVGTHADNSADRKAKNRGYHPTGLKLTKEEKQKAREVYFNSNHTAKSLADMLGVSHRHMQRILAK